MRLILFLLIELVSEFNYILDSSWYLSSAWINQVCKPTTPLRYQINDQSSLLTCTWLSWCIHKATRFWIRKKTSWGMIYRICQTNLCILYRTPSSNHLASNEKQRQWPKKKKKKNLATCIILGPRSPKPLFFQSKSSSQLFFLSLSQKTFTKDSSCGVKSYIFIFNLS